MTGILTFYWADDCGAMLQAYALKYTIEAMGEQAEVIPYAPVKLTGRYWWYPLSAELRDGKIQYQFNLSLFKRNLTFGVGLWKRKQHMKSFRFQYLTKKPPIRDAADISLKKYKQVFVGSDQVWNPLITVDLDDAYVGNMKKRGACQLVSYAASFGGDSLSELDQRKFSESVQKNFLAVSVREKSAVPYTERLIGKRVANVLDPVLLLNRAEWERLAAPPPESGYILIYWTEPNEKLLRYAHSLANRLGKKVIQVSFPIDRKFLKDSELHMDGGPQQFLGYIKNAFCVLTNSFHGTAFSILMEKPFLVFCRSSLNTRMADLLEKLGLLSHMKNQSDPLEQEDIRQPVDWQNIRRRLAVERSQSLQFISDNLGG